MGSCLSMNKMTLDSMSYLLEKQGISISRQALHERMNERTVVSDFSILLVSNKCNSGVGYKFQVNYFIII